MEAPITPPDSAPPRCRHPATRGAAVRAGARERPLGQPVRVANPLCAGAQGHRIRVHPLGVYRYRKAFDGRFKTLPVLEHGDTMLSESWDIAEYIDREFPAGPALFACPAEREMVRLMDSWFASEVMRKLFRIYVLDIHDAARPRDRPYFGKAARRA